VNEEAQQENSGENETPDLRKKLETSKNKEKSKGKKKETLVYKKKEALQDDAIEEITPAAEEAPVERK